MQQPAGAVEPLRELRPPDDAGGGHLGELGQVPEEVDDFIAGVVGSPATIQGSPRSFFSATCSSEITAMTWSFLASRASSLSTLASRAFCCAVKVRRFFFAKSSP
jgi:hypothetical protein